MLRGASVLTRSTARISGRSTRLGSSVRCYSTVDEPKRGSIGKTLLWTTLLTTAAYSGATYYALQNKAFYDTFTTYVPGGEQVLDFLEDLSQDEELRQYATKANELKDFAVIHSALLKTKALEAKDKATEFYENTHDLVSKLKGEDQDVRAQGPAPITRVKRTLKKDGLFTNVMEGGEPVKAAFTPTNIPDLDGLAQTMARLVAVLNESGMTGHAKRLVDFASRDIQLLASDLKSQESEQAELVKQTAALLQIADELQNKVTEHRKEIASKVEEAKAQSDARIAEKETTMRDAFAVENATLEQHLMEVGQKELEHQRTVYLEALTNELKERAIELQRGYVAQVKKQVEEERGGRLSKVDEVVSRQGALERMACTNAEYLDDSRKAHQLLVAIESLKQVAYAGNKQTFLDELKALEALSASSSPFANNAEKQNEALVHVVVSSISKTVAENGIDSLAQLVDRFEIVSREVREASLIPEEGSSMMSHVLSIILSKFLFPKEGLVEGDDIEARLARAKYHLDYSHDLESAAREVNQLKGWPKTLATDWLNAARRHLEVKQALEVRTHY
ncbi:mitochondrial inner membrane protein-domain-containing protein [Phycomyces blakesleeanus]|uniref:MICOS complex subunit MIC60 n=1 Tax=Phycomyces blakesleeanus TaxID=4837 RepID=A0ABR3B066_PHYBL